MCQTSLSYRLLWTTCKLHKVNKKKSIFNVYSINIHTCKFTFNSLNFSSSLLLLISSVQFSLVTQSCLTLKNPRNRNRPSLPVHHQLPESTQTHVRQVVNTIQPLQPLSSPSPPATNLSHYQGIFKWVSSSHEVAKVLEFQLQDQSFQWTPRRDLL